MYLLKEKEGKKIAIVDMLTEESKLFSYILKKTIDKYKSLGKKILFIANRKGYTSSSICVDCGNIPKCDFCDIPIAKYLSKNSFENKDYFYMCPICSRVYENINPCKKCGGTNVKDYGIGTYKFQELLKDQFDLDSIVIENTDINSVSKINKTKLKLKNSKFVISTPIFSSYSSTFSPDLIVFLNADAGLLIPDYNVAEKHFLFMFEFIRNYTDCSNYIIQTYNIDHYVYKYLIDLDIDGFWKKELEYRKQFLYPPYSELALISYKTEIEEKLYRKISKLSQEIKYLIEKDNLNIEIFSTPPLVYKKFGKYHYNIILKGDNIKSFLDKVSVLLKVQQKGFQIDYMPVNIV